MNCGAAGRSIISLEIIWAATLWASCEEGGMLLTPSDGVKIFIVFVVLQSSVFTVLCGSIPHNHQILQMTLRILEDFGSELRG